ncbi:unnamed protein product [Didymodactylos carnosus]|uniref:Tripartite motif-containing protein 2 n=1 Tax=Didymodactylos carnosus TaxID=1234261 RepID=A0A813PAW3_9BILA|nr:unnamed protein product [Didymodactylos carnosus]CAF1024210.1 unnamed protein product [Didymodactylos carnosus]CAF3526778.1 unnamed protein product [Didymodactylos carnosus]CAF3792668.1 unnamed protein product [Didymodactylos carnosus]
MTSTLVETININAKDFTEHFLTCSTCINQYSSDIEHQPKLLPCSHTVCRQCLERIVHSQPRTDAIKCPICREHILLPRGGVTSFPPSFIVNQLLDLMLRLRRDVIPKCLCHTNEELLFCETCDKIFCMLCDEHQISAEHTVVPFSLAIKRMNEILFFKASKTISCLDHAYEVVNNEILRLDSSMEKAAEAINRSFNEIKTYVENRRHNLLQSLKTTKDYKLKILNDQLNVILNEKAKIEHECAIFQQQSDIHVLTQRIQELNDRIERMALLGEPRENSFMKFEFRHNQALQDLARSLNSVGRIRVSSTYPPLCKAKIDPAVSNLQCCIQIETVDYNGNIRVDGGDPLTVNIWDPYGKLCEYDLNDKQSGSYYITFRPMMSGKHKIDIRIFDRPINGSPLTVDVTKHNNPLWCFGKRGRSNKEFSMPVGVIVDSSDFVYVLDPGNSRIKKLTSDGQFVTHLGVDNLIESTCTGLAYRSVSDTFSVIDYRTKCIIEFSFDNSSSQMQIINRLTCPSEIFCEPIQIQLMNSTTHSRLEYLILDSNQLHLIDGQTGQLLKTYDTKSKIKTIKSYTVGLQNELYIADQKIHIYSYDGQYIKQINHQQQIDTTSDIQIHNEPDLITSLGVNQQKRHSKIMTTSISSEGKCSASTNRGFYTALCVDSNGLLLAAKCEKQSAIIEIYDQNCILLRLIDSYSNRLKRPCSLAVTQDGCVYCVDLTTDSIRKYRYA